jgi:predicted O-methyltransferase YrrM
VILPWKEKSIDGGPAIRTSVTDREIEHLTTLAYGKVVLEIGSAYGYSAISLAKGGARRVIAVDPHGGYGSLDGSLQEMRSNLFRYGVDDRVTMVLARSQNAMPALFAAKAKFDLIFIDGDHRREVVEHDISRAIPMLSIRGVIACHDYGEASCEGVREAIDDMRLVDARGEQQVVETLWTWEPGR